jgi:hypothetical protein
MLKVVIKFRDAPTQITPFVSELSCIVSEFDELAKREVSREVLDVVVTLTFYVAWEFTFP